MARSNGVGSILAKGKVRKKEFTRPVGDLQKTISVGSRVPVWYSENHPELLSRKAEQEDFDFTKYHKAIINKKK